MKKHDGHRGAHKRDPQLVREDVLRPSRYLGYDRDQLGVHFMGRNALELAESQFRRAAWLNPREPMFRLHWAMALLALSRAGEAKELVQSVLRDDQRNATAIYLWKRHWPDDSIPVYATGESA